MYVRRPIHGCAVPCIPAAYKGVLSPSRLCKQAYDAVSGSDTILRLRLRERPLSPEKNATGFSDWASHMQPKPSAYGGLTNRF